MKFLIVVLLACCAVAAITDGHFPRVERAAYNGSTTARG